MIAVVPISETSHDKNTLWYVAESHKRMLAKCFQDGIPVHVSLSLAVKPFVVVVNIEISRKVFHADTIPPN